VVNVFPVVSKPNRLGSERERSLPVVPQRKLDHRRTPQTAVASRRIGRPRRAGRLTRLALACCAVVVVLAAALMVANLVPVSRHDHSGAPGTSSPASTVAR
jgi:hypothetical protein